MQLKKCPFCGGEAEIRFSGNDYGNRWKGYIIAGCSFCTATVRGPYYEGPPIEHPLNETVGGENAAKRWNKREEG